MKRIWFSFLLVLVALASVRTAARADDDPELRGRRLSEWIELLCGQRTEADRKALAPALGSGASQPAAWHTYAVQQRRLGLLAVEVIGPGKSRNVLPALDAALQDDPDDKIREAAALALGRCATRLVDNVKDAVRVDPTLERKKVMPELGPVRDALATAMRGDKSPRVREASAAALGKLEWTAALAVPALAQALKDESPTVRTAAAESLRRIGEDAAEALPALQDVLKDDKADKVLRSLAAKVIARQGTDVEVNLELLLKVWHDPAAPNEVRADVGEALGNLKKTAAATDLGTELANAKNDLTVRRAAAVALDSFGADAKPAVAQLRTALKDDDKFVRTLAMHTLGQIGRGLGDERKNVVKDLVAALSDRVLECRVAAIETLGALGADGLGDDLPAVVERLTAAKNDTQKAVREAAENSLKKLGK